MDRKKQQQNKAHYDKKRAELRRLKEIERQYIALLERVARISTISTNGA